MIPAATVRKAAVDRAEMAAVRRGSSSSAWNTTSTRPSRKFTTSPTSTTFWETVCGTAASDLYGSETIYCVRRYFAGDPHRLERLCDAALHATPEAEGGTEQGGKKS